MQNTGNEEPEGTTLIVYSYVVKEGRPVGPRDVMRGVNLSSPSVAYRHLQKLETLGLLIKNEYGEYVVKEKAGISGHLWIGRSLIPRQLLYSLFFMGILIAEIIVLAIHLSVETFEFKVFFLFLALITLAAMVLFLVEGILVLRRIKPNEHARSL